MAVKLDYPADYQPRNAKTRDELVKLALGDNIIKKWISDGKITSKEVQKMSTDDLKRFFYWKPQNTGKITCPALQRWFDEHGMLTEGKAGRQAKDDLRSRTNSRKKSGKKSRKRS